MANIVPFAFKGELASGTHNFANGGDTFKIALYTANPYTTSSTVKVVTNEVSSSGGSNYTAGGNTLTGQSVTASTATTAIDIAITNPAVTPPDTVSVPSAASVASPEIACSW